MRRDAMDKISEWRGSIGDVVEDMRAVEHQLQTGSTNYDPTSLSANLSTVEKLALYSAYHKIVEAFQFLNTIQ